ncbi:IS1634 family transposase [Moorella sp. Hama-1]|uniref:IS1634 family transposase n=1 Tax=Moorella sp. Hama-1 TaxID=2138101 RepID=UPI003D160366
MCPFTPVGLIKLSCEQLRKKERFGQLVKIRHRNYVLKYLDKNILFTNQDEWPDSTIVATYRGQASIEEAFKVMKNPHFIGWSPMYHWTDARIRVHAFYCVLALTLASLLRREIYQKGLDLSLTSLLEELAGIYEVAHIYPPEAKQKDVFTLSACNETQQKLIELLALDKMHQAVA